jgi:hypothetical protein
MISAVILHTPAYADKQPDVTLPQYHGIPPLTNHLVNKTIDQKVPISLERAQNRDAPLSPVTANPVVAKKSILSSAWGIGKSLVNSVKSNVKYIGGALTQIFKSNRLFGPESGSCQSWDALKADSTLYNGFMRNVEETAPYMPAKIYYQSKDAIIACGTVHHVSDGLLEATRLRNGNQAIKTICMPYHMQLTNKVTNAEIGHSLTLELKYDGKILTGIHIIDPQTNISTRAFSNAEEIGKEALLDVGNPSLQAHLKFISAGIQVPLTGNCQKLALYMALQSCQSHNALDVNTLSINKANDFCTKLHMANSKVQ